MTRRLGSRRTGELDPRLAWLLMMLYPRAWRDRYGAEVLRLTRELIAAGETTPARAAVNLACAAVVERCRALGHSWRPAIAVSVAALLALAAGLSVTSHAHRAVSARAAPAGAAAGPAILARYLCSLPRAAPGLRKAPPPRPRPPIVLVLPNQGTHRLCIEARPHIPGKAGPSGP
ncbi:MAG TPA: hypothetical protein VFQ68_22605 [Streptosporangiaceae bacterium]|nr:hypothetical protein [Streptosporangiaceae bacterium]